MALTVAERVDRWRKKQQIKLEAKYISGEIDETKPVNGYASAVRKRWRIAMIRRAAARASQVALPPIKSKT